MARIYQNFERIFNPDMDSEAYRLEEKKNFLLNEWFDGARRLRTGYDLSMVNCLPTLYYGLGVITSTATFAFILKMTHKNLTAATSGFSVALPFYLLYHNTREAQANSFYQANRRIISTDLQKALQNFETNEVEPFLPHDYEQKRNFRFSSIRFDI